jgi:hypothetical protein
MIIGGIQVSQLPGAAAVSIFNLIYEGRELAHTHDAFAKISELRPLAQAMNIRLTPNAPRLQPAGAKTELSFSPFEALSLFHIIGQNITLRQTELSFVTGRIAANAAHEEEDEAQGNSPEDMAATIAEHLTNDEMQALLNKLGEIAEEEDSYTIALALINLHGAQKVFDALTELDIHLDFIGDGADLSDAEIAQAENLEYAAEIQDQLTDDQINNLIKEFITEEDEDDEQDILLDLIIERHGICSVGQKITDLGFEFSSDLDPAEDADDEDEEEDFGGGDEGDHELDDEDDSEDHGLSDYALTVLRNDLTALHHNDRVIIANEVGVAVGHDTAELVEELMGQVPDVLDALEEHDIKLPNFDAVMRATDEDEDREERLHRLDIQDLEILCDVLGINRVDQDHDELIDLLCTRPQSEFVSALFIADITMPSLNYENDEPTIDEYRANFEHIAALTMLQSAVATCIADGQQDLVLSFTH